MSNIKLVHSGGNSVSLTTPDSNPAANRTFKLPGADGTSGQALVTDGSGALSFQTQGYGLFHVRANQNDGDTPQTVATWFKSHISTMSRPAVGNVTQLKFPLPSVCKTCPALPSD